jgi:hypothetical protein
VNPTAFDERFGTSGTLEVAPGDEQGQDLGLAGAGGHFEHEARQVLIEHIGRYGTGCVLLNQVIGREPAGQQGA